MKSAVDFLDYVTIFEVISKGVFVCIFKIFSIFKKKTYQFLLKMKTLSFYDIFLITEK